MATTAHPTWPAPQRVTECAEAARADQGNRTAAHEYMDSDDVLEQKIEYLAELIRKAKCCCAYTGAGLSKSSGIPDYATKAKDSVVAVAEIRDPLDALPTLAHRVLCEMERRNHLHYWVQQNHDGLPQKAGFPQEKINEIHGAWFDPSNPVVQFNESLRGDLFAEMIRMEHEVDLCLCLGTSLSGMNADRMARTPANRTGALGTVVVNLQETPLDDACCLRIWAKLDDVFRRLAEKLHLTIPPLPTPRWDPTQEVFVVPYNEQGARDPTCAMTLDLRPQAALRIAPPEASNSGQAAKVVGYDRAGNWEVACQGKTKRIHRMLGRWMIEAATRGALPQLPVVNAEPVIERNVAREAHSTAFEDEDMKVAQLVDMGFDADIALKALRKYRGSLPDALEALSGE